MSLWFYVSGKGSEANEGGEVTDLVLLHGWGMNSAVWQPVLEQLEKSFRVTLIDLPGHGYSQNSHSQNSYSQNSYSCESKRLNGSLDEWVTAIEAVLPDKSILMGWSLGGLLAMQLTLQYPDRFSGVIMITATPSFMQRDDWPCAMQKNTLENFADNLKSNIKSTLNRFLSLQIQGCDDARNLLKQLKAGFASRPQAEEHALETGLSFLHDIDIRNELASLSIPSLWIYGEKDTLVPACSSQSIANLLPGSTVKQIKGAGHVPFLSHVNETLQEIMNWKQANV